MKFFKNFKTKKQLRKENEMLKTLATKPGPIRIVDNKSQKFSCCMETDGRVPIEVIHAQIAKNLAKELESLITWEVEDCSDEYRYCKIVKGEIYLPKGGRTDAAAANDLWEDR